MKKSVKKDLDHNAEVVRYVFQKAVSMANETDLCVDAVSRGKIIQMLFYEQLRFCVEAEEE